MTLYHDLLPVMFKIADLVAADSAIGMAFVPLFS